MESSAEDVPQFPEAPTPTVSAAPAQGEIYRYNFHRANLGELWRETQTPAVLILWLAKMLRIPARGWMIDFNVRELSPFEIEPDALPAPAQAAVAPVLALFRALGFAVDRAISHAIIDIVNGCRAYVISFPSGDGRAVARIISRPGAMNRRDHRLYWEIISEAPDGRFLWSTSAWKTMDLPDDVIRLRVRGAPPVELWDRHRTQVRQLFAGRATMAADVSVMRLLLGRHQAKIRDFHLSRGVFQTAPQPVPPQANLGGSAQKPLDFENANLLVHLDQLQNRNTSWTLSIVLLGISLLIFLAAGFSSGTGSASSRGLEYLFLLVPILFFHESGHYVAMRMFNYRNVRMFFIPFFGAAVSGQNYSAPAWKKVIVALMGPLPGIILGGLAGLLGIVLHYPFMVRLGLLALILNGLNLLPVYPLDGGRVVQTLIFARNFMLDTFFRAAAGAVLIYAGTRFDERVLMYLGIAMLITIPVTLRLGSVARSLRREGLTVPPEDGHNVPPDVALAIAGRLRQSTPAKQQARGYRLIAPHTLQVYEMMASRPPGAFATIGLLGLHAVGLAAAVVFACVLVVAQSGSLSALMRTRATLGSNLKYVVSAYQSGSRFASLRAPATQPSDAITRATIIASFTNTVAQTDSAAKWVIALHPDESLETFGQSVLISYPATDDSERQRWISLVKTGSDDFFVASDGAPRLSISFKTLNQYDATKIKDEINDYIQAPAALHLIVPWSPDDTRTPGQRLLDQTARHTFAQMRRPKINLADPRFKDILAKTSDAARAGDTAELKRLQTQEKVLLDQLEREAIDELRQTTDGSVDQEIVREYPLDKSAKPDFTLPVYQAMASRMGQRPAPSTTQPSRSSYGFASQSATQIEVYGLSLIDAPTEAPALVRWLNAHDCTSIRYQFEMPLNPADDGDDGP